MYGNCIADRRQSVPIRGRTPCAWGENELSSPSSARKVPMTANTPDNGGGLTGHHGRRVTKASYQSSMVDIQISTAKVAVLTEVELTSAG